jgi:hypothetical protein
METPKKRNKGEEILKIMQEGSPIKKIKVSDCSMKKTNALGGGKEMPIPLLEKNKNLSQFSKSNLSYLQKAPSYWKMLSQSEREFLVKNGINSIKVLQDYPNLLNRKNRYKGMKKPWQTLSEMTMRSFMYDKPNQRKIPIYNFTYTIPHPFYQENKQIFNHYSPQKKKTSVSFEEKKGGRKPVKPIIPIDQKNRNILVQNMEAVLKQKKRKMKKVDIKQESPIDNEVQIIENFFKEHGVFAPEDPPIAEIPRIVE